MDRLGRIGNHQTDPSRVPMKIREGVKFLHDQIAQTVEVMGVSMPSDSTTLTPNKPWRVTQAMPLKFGFAKERGSVEFQYTYLGTRERNGRCFLANRFRQLLSSKSATRRCAVWAIHRSRARLRWIT